MTGFDDEPMKIRTSFMSYSIAIIIYVLGDASIGDEGKILGGSLAFNPDRMWLIKTVLVSLFVYLFWRYHINAKFMMINLKNDIGIRVVRMEGYLDFALNILRSKLNDNQIRSIEENRDNWMVSDLVEPVRTYIIPPLPEGDKFILHGQANSSHSSVWYERLINSTQLIKVRLSPEERKELKKFTVPAKKQSIKESNEYYQAIVPYYVGVFAALLLICNISPMLLGVLLTLGFVCWLYNWITAD